MACLDLDLSEQQVLLREAVQRVTGSIDQPQWDDLCDRIGLAGLTLPEAAGGFGGGVVDIAVVMAELGPALAGADWLSHAAACLVADERTDGSSILTDQHRVALVCEASAATMPVVVEGGRIEGSATLVFGAARADLYVLEIAGELFAVDASAAGVHRDVIAMHDGSLVGNLYFHSVSARAIGRDMIGANGVMHLGRCAEAVGLMHRMLADTADYLGQRRQFGAPISSFQALRHRLADMHLATAQAQALTEAGVVALHERQEGCEATIVAACFSVRDAARIVGEGAVQLHGAMGLTEELRLGLRFKRLLTIAAGFGSEAALVGKLLAA